MNTKITDIIKKIDEKNSNIILAFDNDNFTKLCDLINKIHSYIIGVKVHNEILNLTNEQNILLYNLCKNYSLFLWEDRKFNDISNTVMKQLKKYEDIRDFVSICPISGPDILKIKSNLGFFVLIEMSSEQNLFTPITNSIFNFVVQEANIPNNNICGIICQKEKYFRNDKLLTIKPGIHLTNTKDNVGQKYTNPKYLQTKPSLFVVGRGITESENPLEEIKKYISI